VTRYVRALLMMTALLALGCAEKARQSETRAAAVQDSSTTVTRTCTVLKTIEANDAGAVELAVPSDASISIERDYKSGRLRIHVGIFGEDHAVSATIAASETK